MHLLHASFAISGRNTRLVSRRFPYRHLRANQPILFPVASVQQQQRASFLAHKQKSRHKERRCAFVDSRVIRFLPGSQSFSVLYRKIHRKKRKAFFAIRVPLGRSTGRKHSSDRRVEENGGVELDPGCSLAFALSPRSPGNVRSTVFIVITIVPRASATSASRDSLVTRSHL